MGSIVFFFPEGQYNVEECDVRETLETRRIERYGLREEKEKKTVIRERRKLCRDR